MSEKRDVIVEILINKINFIEQYSEETLLTDYINDPESFLDFIAPELEALMYYK